MRRKGLVFLVLMGILGYASSGAAYAVSPTEVQAGMAAAPAAASAANLAGDVVWSAGRVVYLPVGVAEVVLSPLPGISAGSGLAHIAKGVLAPIQTAVGLLKLPLSLVRAPANQPRECGFA